MSLDTTTDEKSTLRATAHEMRAKIGSTARNEAAQLAAKHFFDAVEIMEGQTISGYWPIRDELDCRPVLSRLVDDGHRVCLPVVMGDEAPLLFRLWALGQPLYPAGFGTLVPPEEAPCFEPDILIVPLLGFDSSGTRLGYGRGHYDRSIVGFAKRPYLVGYAFSSQELPNIPRAEHDVPLDMIVTERGARHFAQTAN